MSEEELIQEFLNDLKHISLYEKYNGYDEEFIIKVIEKWEKRL